MRLFRRRLQGVFLEGTEVALIVIRVGAAQHRLGLAALAAAAAAVLVAVVGLVVARQLSEVPENTIKTVVGVMLSSFGVFWVGEAPACTGRATTSPSRCWWASGSWSTSPSPPSSAPSCRSQLPKRWHRERAAALRSFGHFWWDFLVGDTPELGLATAAIVGLAFLLAGPRLIGAILLPL